MTEGINAAGLALLKRLEAGPHGGPALVAYRCPAGVLTIGWGSTRDVRDGMRITPMEAERRLRDDLGAVETAVADMAQPASACEYAAMVLLAFNIGVGAFRGSSVLRLHRAGDRAGAARAFLLWNKLRAGGRLVESAGLVRRRAAEMALYLASPSAAATPSPQKVAGERPLAASRTAAGAALGAVLVGAQQAVAQVEPVWTGLRALGIEPRVALALLGLMALGTLGVVLIERVRRWRQGGG